ncbi:MAG: hypothetical protein DRP11_02110, partial [Candidatus Aenigmatarchaeota archaeon]
VIISPELQRKIKSLNKEHRNLILKAFRKIKKMGLNAVTILRAHDNYLLCEIKYKKPPYRLYVTVDQKEKIFILCGWEHKEKQERMKNTLSKNIKEGVYEILRQNLFST